METFTSRTDFTKSELGAHFVWRVLGQRRLADDTLELLGCEPGWTCIDGRGLLANACAKFPRIVHSDTTKT